MIGKASMCWTDAAFLPSLREVVAESGECLENSKHHPSHESESVGLCAEQSAPGGS